MKVGRPEMVSKYQKSLNVSAQNCKVYWSKVWMQLIPKFMCAIYITVIPFSAVSVFQLEYMYHFIHVPIVWSAIFFQTSSASDEKPPNSGRITCWCLGLEKKYACHKWFPFLFLFYGNHKSLHVTYNFGLFAVINQLSEVPLDDTA